MNNYTREDILRMVEEEDVGFIRLQFTDIFGTMKNIAITTSQLEKALDNEIMFDGSSIEGFARVEESDMYLYPNLNTFAGSCILTPSTQLGGYPHLLFCLPLQNRWPDILQRCKTPV